ncbi:MAG TPA: hypothetical protein DCR77_07855, partial [Flavobacteriaceae bacterium]|nr:hypothetical protein [Flavobacteriaceae bacterium]
LFRSPLFVLSCSTNKSSKNQDNFDDRSNLILELNENSLENFDSVFTIKNDTELGQTLGPINATRMPGVPIGDINFNKVNLVVFNIKPDDLKNDINIIDIKNGVILYEKIKNKNSESTSKQENLIKFYKIPFSNSLYKFKEIN